MISALDSGASARGSGPAGDIVTLLSRCLSPRRYINGYRQTYYGGGIPAMV